MGGIQNIKQLFEPCDRVIDITFGKYITYVQCAVISMHMKLHNGTFGAMNGLFLRSKNWCYRNEIAF